MRIRIALALCATVALTIGVAAANAGGGNSANAKLCQKGGWQDWYRSDGTSFANQDTCVAYAAGGGTLISAGQAACQSVGGTFAGPSGEFDWLCTYTYSLSSTITLSNECAAESGLGGWELEFLYGTASGLRTDGCMLV